MEPQSHGVSHVMSHMTQLGPTDHHRQTASTTQFGVVYRSKAYHVLFLVHSHPDWVALVAFWASSW